MKPSVRFSLVFMIVPISLGLAQSSTVKRKPMPASKADKVSQKTWIFRESKDPMTDVITRTLFLYGSSVAPSGVTDKEPFLFVTCDPDTPRKLVINLGVLSDDAHPMVRFDQEPATSDQWVSTEDTDRAFYKDDSVGLTGPLHDPKMKRVRDIVNGADAFVKEMSEHNTLLVKSNVFDDAPKIVSFDISGLSALLTSHGCPVKN